MPNLKQLIKLKNKYARSNYNLMGTEVRALLEAFDPGKTNRAFDIDGSKLVNYTDYFKERKKAEVVLLFIDITSFSTRFSTNTSSEIAQYLDDYYDKVIPLIGENDGEIEKIIGDGIICVFGEPFLTSTKYDLHRKAEKCAMKIINELKGTVYECKVAFHYGEIMYFQNKSEDYNEFTMIGNALTNLFRLESVAYTNSINYFTETYYNTLNKLDISTGASNYSWILTDPEFVNLKGVHYNSIRRLQKM